MVQIQFSHTIKILQTYNAIEYKVSNLLTFLTQQGTLI